MNWVYLDNNATTRPAPEVAAVIREAIETLWANPSSVHRFGQQVRQRMELARQSVADLIGARPRDIVFTSGGTESNNLAIHGVLEPLLPGAGRTNILENVGTSPGRKSGESSENNAESADSGTAHPPEGRTHILENVGTSPAVLVTTPVEHSAVREPAEWVEKNGGTVVRLGVNDQGLIDVGELERTLDAHAADGRVVLLSVQWANNETGALQPVAAIAAAVQAARQRARAAGERAQISLHFDATQAVGKLPVDIRALPGLDLLTLAAHKFHGPKGIGALWVRSGVRLRAVQRGGPQERERRGGTENVPGILGMGVAADLARAWVASTRATDVAALRDRFEQTVLRSVPGAVVNAARAPRLWNTTNIAFPGLEAEAILLGLSERGVCASAGAACSSGSLEPSPVLLAMGLPEPVAHGSVRFSLSRYTTAEEVDAAARVVGEVVSRLGQTMPMGA